MSGPFQIPVTAWVECTVPVQAVLSGFQDIGFRCAQLVIILVSTPDSADSECTYTVTYTCSSLSTCDLRTARTRPRRPDDALRLPPPPPPPLPAPTLMMMMQHWQMQMQLHPSLRQSFCWLPTQVYIRLLIRVVPVRRSRSKVVPCRLLAVNHTPRAKSWLRRNVAEEAIQYCTVLYRVAG